MFLRICRMILLLSAIPWLLCSALFAVAAVAGGAACPDRAMGFTWAAGFAAFAVATVIEWWRMRPLERQVPGRA